MSPTSLTSDAITGSNRSNNNRKYFLCIANRGIGGELGYGIIGEATQKLIVSVSEILEKCFTKLIDEKKKKEKEDEEAKINNLQSKHLDNVLPPLSKELSNRSYRRGLSGIKRPVRSRSKLSSGGESEFSVSSIKSPEKGGFLSSPEMDDHLFATPKRRKPIQMGKI
mmetsp:Transcript_10390/g.10463  ORF Transcript_10390/g.10463 Transcript_10390/m.10463 type:complete len:167 (+) Transcript_10390:375-875(+)